MKLKINEANINWRLLSQLVVIDISEVKEIRNTESCGDGEMTVILKDGRNIRTNYSIDVIEE